MAENNEMKTYDFIEGTEFNGLMPKAMEGYSTGKGAGYSHLFRFSVPDALEVVSIDAIFEAGSKKDDSQSGSTPSDTDSGSTDSGSSIDSGSTDSGSTDSGSSVDSGSTDSGSSIDSGSTDSGSSIDSGSTDSGSSIDSGSTDSGSTDSGSSIDSGSTEPEIVKPAEVPNTQEQEQAAQDMANALTDESGGTQA